MAKGNALNSNIVTFTPTLLFGGGNTGMTGTFLGAYIKTGPQVDLSIIITLTAKGSSTGNASIGNLPFAGSATAGAQKWLTLYLQNCTLNGSTFTQTAAQAGAGTASLSGLFEFSQASDIALNIANANFDNDAIVIVSGTYWTDV